MLSKKIAICNKKVCVSCGTCTKVCPPEAVSVYKGCYAVVDRELCVGCGKCAGVCPVSCITVREREAVNE
ncbi:MAG: 4Fe-4S binding protein [Firmicutes bacterium]|nr:4Fe-4S binding protein [Bacillota bacterium]